MKNVAVNLCRLLLSGVFIFSGFVKAIDPQGTQYKITDYLQALHLGGLLPPLATLGLSVGLAAIEFCLGIFMLFAIRRKLTTRIVVLMMAIMTPLTLWLAVANPISDCGCFGDAIVLTNWQTFAKNVVLLVAALVTAKWPKEMFRFVSESNQWIVINYTFLFVLGISSICLYYLPLFDFRPYHIGTDLRQGWQQMMEGEESPYADFFIERTDNGEDITEAVLSDSSYVFLLVASHLEEADDSRLDLLNELYEYAKEHGYLFLGLTASGEQAIERWRDMTGAEYDFCHTDDITLKTVVRSNPGLLLLKNGTIINKWSCNDLPEVEEELTAKPLEQLEIGTMGADSVPTKLLKLLTWFVLPLTILVVADRTWMWTKWVRRKRRKLLQNVGAERILHKSE